MSKIPGLTGAKLIKALKKTGFEDIRTKGSHHFLKHIYGRMTTVPVHRGETIGVGLLRKIMRDDDLSGDELIDLL